MSVASTLKMALCQHVGEKESREYTVINPRAGAGIVTSYAYFDTSHNDIPISVAPA